MVLRVFLMGVRFQVCVRVEATHVCSAAPAVAAFPCPLVPS